MSLLDPCPDCKHRTGLCDSCLQRLHEAMRGAAFKPDAVKPITIAPHSVVVYLDGRPYAGFVDSPSANEAVRLWRRMWPAAKGRDLVVGSGGGR